MQEKDRTRIALYRPKPNRVGESNQIFVDQRRRQPKYQFRKAKAAEHFETWGGGLIFYSLHAQTPTQIFQNTLCVVCWHKPILCNLHSVQCVRNRFLTSASVKAVVQAVFRQFLSHLRAENVHSDRCRQCHSRQRFQSAAKRRGLYPRSHKFLCGLGLRRPLAPAPRRLC